MFASTDTHCQDKERLRASLTSNVAVDYTGVVPSWGSKRYTASAFVDEWLSQVHLGLKPLATQHLLALHYFKGVSDSEIVVEWQQIASHGWRGEGEDSANPMCKTEAESNHRSYMQHTFVKAVEDCSNLGLRSCTSLAISWRLEGWSDWRFTELGRSGITLLHTEINCSSRQ